MIHYNIIAAYRCHDIAEIMLSYSSQFIKLKHIHMSSRCKKKEAVVGRLHMRTWYGDIMWYETRDKMVPNDDDLILSLSGNQLNSNQFKLNRLLEQNWNIMRWIIRWNRHSNMRSLRMNYLRFVRMLLQHCVNSILKIIWLNYLFLKLVWLKIQHF